MPDFRKIAITQWSGTNVTSITPSDSADLAFYPRGIYVGTSGDLRISDVEGDIVTFENLAAGVIHPLSPKRIYATGTTATGIIAVT